MFSALQYRKTYRAGLLQAKAYRILKSETARVLRPYRLTTVAWSVLGILYDTTNGCTVKVLADDIGVRMPFMTNVVGDLVEKGFVARAEGAHDRRTKQITLTKKGKKLVQTVEPKLKKALKPLFGGVSAPAGLTYISVLDTVVKNGAAIEVSNDFESFAP